MVPVLVALTTTVIGLLVPFAVLRKRDVLLRSKEQAYRFHELRDRLQILNVEGKIEAASISYLFLMSSLNLAIKNAGVMTLSDVLQISRAVRKKAEYITFEQIADDVRGQSEEARILLAEFFQSLTVMLISNDGLVRLVFNLAKPPAGSFKRAALRTIASIGKALAPTHTEAIYEARDYQRWGKALAPSY
jgi:hypothetical protein